MAQPVFRFATIEDVEQLTHLRILMQAETNKLEPAAISSDYRKKVKDYFSEELGSGALKVAVAEFGGELLAFNCVIFYKKPPSLKKTHGLFGYVSSVYTHSDWRGKGIAKILLDMVISEAKRRKTDKLHLCSSEMGLTLYKKADFVPPQDTYLELKFQELL